VSTGIPATRMMMQSRTVRALLPMAYRMVRHLFSAIAGGSAALAAVCAPQGRARPLAPRPRDLRE
jgi:hypothetical protein